MSDLQTAVSNLQDKHGELVDAVRNASGSRTVAGETNDAMGEALVAGRRVKDSVSRLRNQIENDGQSLILDWEHDVAVVNGEGRPINEVVEFSRSTGGGRLGPDGKYEWVEADVPRINYDPETGQCLGLLVEEQRTNIFPNSRGAGNLASAPVFAENAAVGLDGTMSATVWREVTSGANRYELRTGELDSMAPGSIATVSWYEKPISVTSRGLSPRGHVGFSNVSSVVERPAGNGWIRCHILLEAIAVDELRRIRFYQNSGVASSTTDLFAVDGIQVEEGTFPTSLIPTEGTAVTRAADVVNLNTVEPWFNRSEGTFYANMESASGVSSGNILRERGSARFLYRTGSNPIAAYDGNITAGISSSSVLPVSAASWYDNNSFGVAGDGRVGGARQGGASLRAVQSLRLMEDSGGKGTIKRLEYYPRALSDTELQELTSL